MPSRKNLTRLALAAMASVSAIALTPAAEAGTVKPVWGSLNPVWGSLNPVWGSLNPVWGSLNPVWGSLNPVSGGNAPFWGSLNPVGGNPNAVWGSITAMDGSSTALNPYTASSSSINGVSAFWGTKTPYTNNMTAAGLNTYWATTGATMKAMDTAWGAIPAGASASAYDSLVTSFRDLHKSAADFWNPAIKAQTGGTPVWAAVYSPLLSRYNIDLSDPTSLAGFDQTKRALFFLDFYDSLMNYTGTDHIDYWMNLVNWSPSLTQTQGFGSDTTIGLLDLTVSGNTTVTKNIVAYNGVSGFNNGHGVAVGSLMVGRHDGTGVMGIAPRANVIGYNPFDSTSTANWTDITTGVIALTTGTAAYKGASIVNASLGEPGSTLPSGWNTVFTSAGVQSVAKKTVFVLAAGNEGVAQTTNVTWDFARNPDILIVGSVGINGTISSFSNMPGNACMLASGTSTCLAGNYLKDHFLVAPGEMILVDNDQGGVVRQSGTSFAAPLVSGAVALLHDRWKWLASYPKVTDYIILNTAKDLGAPGVDPVYGHGLLDVTAAQSPINWDNLVYYTGKKKDTTSVTTTGIFDLSDLKATTIKQLIADVRKDKNMKALNAQGLYFYGIEEFDPLTGSNLMADGKMSASRTRRDFAIPVARVLIGQDIKRASGDVDKFGAYLLDRMGSWVDSKPALAEGSSGTSFAGFANGVAMRNPWGAEMSLSVAPQSLRYGFVQSGVAYQSRLHVAGDGSEAELGFGDGAIALGAMPGFSQATDYDANHGGANPLLGLASGGAFGKIAFNLTDNLQVSAGATQRNDLRDTGSDPGLRVLGNGAERYRAMATQIGVNLKVADGVHILGGLTHLTEPSGMLGIQSLIPGDLGTGSTTDGYNIGVDAALGPDTRLAITGTVGQTRTRSGQAFATTDARSSAYELALTQGNLLARGDVARISLSQPLHVEKGDLAFTSYQIVNRDTGDLGLFTQHIGLASARPLSMEMLYGRPVLKGLGEVSFYGRVDTDTTNTETTYMSGARFKVHF